MMDPMARSQADVLGIPLLEGLGTGEAPVSVWRSENMEAVSLVHSYNLPPEQESGTLLLDQCNQHLVQEKSGPGLLYLDISRVPTSNICRKYSRATSHILQETNILRRTPSSLYYRWVDPHYCQELPIDGDQVSTLISSSQPEIRSKGGPTVLFSG